MTTASVELWGSRIGAVTWDRDREVALFEYDPAFVGSGVQVAPLTMPLAAGVFSFPALGRDTFQGLPGLLADSLPDRFGNALIDAWLASRGRSAESFDPVERLCYVGRRGMGALEFGPALGRHATKSERLDLGALVELASAVLTDREGFETTLREEARTRAVRDILRVGTSAGGARAKAVIAWNPDTGEVRSGQVEAGSGFSHWILKFDGVAGDTDREVDVPLGYGKIEYAYHLMARAAGVEMRECRLLAENGRHHFVTRRFDRTDEGDKVHMQTLCALAHLDFNMPGAHSWEQAIDVARRLELPMASIEELYRRMAFNVVARNQDDHTKNIAFLMDRAGRWSLAPAYDLTYSYNPDGRWTNRHQMSIAGKRDDFERADFASVGKVAGLVRGRALGILDEVSEAVAGWAGFAEAAGVGADHAQRIGAAHRALGRG